MKVFEVIIYSCYDFESDVNTEIFETYEKAKEYFEDRVETARLESEEYLEEEERRVTSLEDYYNVYKYGDASTYDVVIRIFEKEVK